MKKLTYCALMLFVVATAHAVASGSTVEVSPVVTDVCQVLDGTVGLGSVVLRVEGAAPVNGEVGVAHLGVTPVAVPVRVPAFVVGRVSVGVAHV